MRLRRYELLRRSHIPIPAVLWPRTFRRFLAVHTEPLSTGRTVTAELAAQLSVYIRSRASTYDWSRLRGDRGCARVLHPDRRGAVARVGALGRRDRLQLPNAERPTGHPGVGGSARESRGPRRGRSVPHDGPTDEAPRFVRSPAQQAAALTTAMFMLERTGQARPLSRRRSDVASAPQAAQSRCACGSSACTCPAGRSCPASVDAFSRCGRVVACPKLSHWNSRCAGSGRNRARIVH